MSNRKVPDDPMERLIYDALVTTGEDFTMEGEHRQTLDFYVPSMRSFIEVKQFHSDRISVQMSREPNIIVAQGRSAVEALAYLIRERFYLARELRETTAALVEARDAR